MENANTKGLMESFKDFSLMNGYLSYLNEYMKIY